MQSEKEKRRQIKQELRQRNKNGLLNSLPISIEMLQSYFNFLDEKLAKNGCENSLNFTLVFIKQHNLPKNDLIEWLKNNGGYCDCEVLANVESEVNDK